MGGLWITYFTCKIGDVARDTAVFVQFIHLLIEEILNDETRPDYMGELELGDESILLSNRLGAELAGIRDLAAFIAGDVWLTGDVGGHPERFTWMAGRHKQQGKGKVRLSTARNRHAAAQGGLMPSDIYGSTIAEPPDDDGAGGAAGSAGGQDGTFASGGTGAAQPLHIKSRAKSRSGRAIVSGAAAATVAAAPSAAAPPGLLNESKSDQLSTSRSGAIELTVLGDGDANEDDDAEAVRTAVINPMWGHADCASRHQSTELQ